MAHDGAGQSDPDPSGGSAASDGAPPTVRVRTGTVSDARAAADLHADQISQGFLSVLGSPLPGPPVPAGSAWTPTPSSSWAEVEGTTVGFIAGSTDVGGLYRSFLVRDGVVAALQSCRHLAPEWRRVVETLRHGSRTEPVPGGAPSSWPWPWTGSCQGKGSGRTLVAAFLAEVSARRWRRRPRGRGGGQRCGRRPSTGGPASRTWSGSSSTPAPSPCSCSGTADPADVSLAVIGALIAAWPGGDPGPDPTGHRRGQPDRHRGPPGVAQAPDGAGPLPRGCGRLRRVGGRRRRRPSDRR